MKKSTLIGISIISVFILCSLSYQPIIADEYESINNVSITCYYIRPTKTIEINKNISSKETQRIIELMETTNYDSIINELYKLDLIPYGMTYKDIINLISGEYSKRLLSNRFVNNINNDLRPLENKSNIFSFVSGRAKVDDFGNPPILLLAFLSVLLNEIDIFLKQFPFYPIFKFGVGEGNVYRSLIALISHWILVLTLGLSEFFVLFGPIKLGSLLLGELNYLNKTTKAKISTNSILGNWTMEHWKMNFIMLGFTGIWIELKFEEYKDRVCVFNGFCLYVSAKEVFWSPHI